MSSICRRASRRPAKKIIHVDQLTIRRNKRDGRKDPPVTVRYRGQTVKGSSVRIHGPSTLVYSPDKPLSCGARLWLESESPVTVDHPEHECNYGPQVLLHVTLVEHGLQADFGTDLDERLSICRDFGGSHKIAELRRRLIAHLETAVLAFVRNPTGK